MTLYKQLWIAILILLSIIFVGSVFTSSMSAQQYMERSVSGHNQNYANFSRPAAEQRLRDGNLR